MNANDVISIVSRLLSDPQNTPGMMRYTGWFRGFVEDVVDPQQRARVRVRIPSIHGNIATPALPWAERVLPDGGNTGYGSFTPLRAGFLNADGSHTGDAVWIVFEGMNPEAPIVVGTWYAAPQGNSQAPQEIVADSGQRRRYVTKTRHGSKIEVSDDQNDFEIKIAMPGGNILHMRESSGGRGIHFTTADGNKISLQDEQPGVAAPDTSTEYDSEQESRAVFDPVSKSPTRQLVQFPRSVDPNGDISTVTSGQASTFGTRGVLIETTSGHKVAMRDVSPRTVTVTTSRGNIVEMNDDSDSIRVETVGGQSIQLRDSDRKIEMRAGAEIVLQADEAIRMSAPFIGMNCVSLGCFTEDGSSIQMNGGVFTVTVTGSLNVLHA